MPEPRITIGSNPTTFLQRFEFPLNGQTFNAIGITTKCSFALDTKKRPERRSCSKAENLVEIRCCSLLMTVTVERIELNFRDIKRLLCEAVIAF